MTAAEADALKMLSKTTEEAEAPISTETLEGALKIVAEAHKRLEMVLEELNLMDYEAGAANQIIQGVVEMVAATKEEELHKMVAAEADAFKMLSTMAEAAEAPMPMRQEREHLRLCQKRRISWIRRRAGLT